MRFFGVEINSGKKIDKLNNDIDKAYTDAKFGNMRTRLDYLKSLGSEEVRIPYYPVHVRTLFDLAVYSDVLRTVHMQLKKEIFRHGYETEEVFAMKCNNDDCGKEFEHPVTECDKCKGKDLRDPDTEQKERLERFLKRCNDNNQDILEVSREINDDLETVDDGFMLLVKDYYFDETTGEFKASVPVELIRSHPMNIKIIADNTGRPGRDQEGRQIFVCVSHRNMYYYDKTNCPSCNQQLFPAYFRGEQYGYGGGYMGPGEGSGEGNYIYYVKGEVCHKSKYLPSLTYGFPPILSIWTKLSILINQDEYMNKYYSKQRPPRGLLFVNTPNMDSLQKAWNWMLDKFKSNPHFISPMAVESPAGNRGKFVEFIDFMKTLDEMQFVETRNEFRRAIGCYDEKTEILTDEGWKYFKDLNKTEKVAQVNSETMNMEWIKPTHYFEYDYNDKMIEIKTKSMDLLVTPNHNMFISDETSFYKGKPKWRFERADKIGRCVIPQACNWASQPITEFVLPEIRYQKSRKILEKRFSGNDFCAFMGIWLSEGCTTYPKQYRVEIAQSKKVNQKKYGEIEELLSRLPFNILEFDDRFRISSKQLFIYLRQFGKCRDKFVPEIIKNSSKEQIKIFLDWFLMGDGCKRKWKENGNEIMRFGSMSETMIDDIQELLIKIGYSCTKYKRKDGYCTVDTRTTKNNLDKNYSRIRKEYIKEKNYNGKIYCIEVPTHIIIVRRNGRVSLCSQSIYGVMPLFQADLSGSGGLNNEGLQITVTNRAIQDGQGVFNEGFYPWLLEQLGVTDYKLILNPSEEKDEMAEQQLIAQKMTNAKLMQSMGFDIIFNEEEDFEFEPTEEVVEPPEQAMGGFGTGLPGIGAKPAGPQTPKMPGSQQRFGSEPESSGKTKTIRKLKKKVIELKKRGKGAYEVR